MSQKIVCNNLIVEDNQGGFISLSFENGRPILKLSEGDKQGSVAIGIDDNGGVVAIFGNDGFVRTELRVSNEGIGYVVSGDKHTRKGFIPN